MTIFMIDDTPGNEGEATATNERMANALKVYGFRECTQSEWEAMRALIQELDNQELDDSAYTDDEEEDLIRAGLCPECGGELDVCGHGADWFDEDEAS